MGELSIGDRVSIGYSKFGFIAFIGETKFKSGEWYGIVLDQSEGRNDGSVEGTRYFQCKPKHGLFVRKSNISKLVKRYPHSSETETLKRTKKKTTRTHELPSSSSTQKTFLTVTGKPDKPTFKVGSRISLKDGRHGTLLYIGATDFKSGTWAGIELDDRCGRHDGSVKGRRYFKCKQMHGMLVPIDKLFQGTMNKTPTSTDNVSLTVSTENPERHHVQYKTSTLLSSDAKSFTVSPESTRLSILDQTPTLKPSNTTRLTVSPDSAFQPVLYQTPVLQSKVTTSFTVSPQNTIPTVTDETITLHYTDIKGMTLSPESTEPIVIEQTATLQSKVNISLAESHQKITPPDTGYSNHGLHKYYERIISDVELDKGVLDYLISSCAMTIEDREEVNRESTRSGRNRIILDILIARPYQICFLFKEALQNGDPCNSELVAELDFTTECTNEQDEQLDQILEDERIIADHKIRLQKNYKKIIDAINVTGDICDSLVSESVIKLDDLQEVTAQKNITESNRFLLLKLIHGPLSAYTTFINILRSDQTYLGLADDIEQTPVTKDDTQRLKIGQLMLKDRQDCRQGHKDDPIPENRREQTRICLNEWRRENSTFVITSAAKKVCTLIRDNNCVTVVGNSGVGKTAAVRNAALKVQRNDFIVVPVSTPEEIVKFCNHKRKTLFVIDDLCGRYTLNQQYLDDWKQRLDEI